MTRRIIVPGMAGAAVALMLLANPPALGAGASGRNTTVFPGTLSMTTGPVGATTGSNATTGRIGPGLPPITTGMPAATASLPAVTTGLPPLTTQLIAPSPLGRPGGTSLTHPGAAGPLATPPGARMLRASGTASNAR